MSDRATLKTFFETGDFPSEAQYADFIDSAPNVVDDYANVPSYHRIARVDVPTAQVLNLFTTPQTIVPAPGGGLAVFPHKALIQLIFNGITYATSTGLRLFFPTSTNEYWSISQLLNSNISLIRPFDNVILFATNRNQVIANQPLQLQAQIADPTLGNSDLRVFVDYSIISV